MPLSEFELIERYFSGGPPQRSDVLKGVGDDAALLIPPEGHDIMAAVETITARHDRPGESDPAALAHRALANPLSRLAAAGALPAWATLSLTLPGPNDQWLHDFARAFLALATRFNIQLVGGDITRGPQAITVMAHGIVPCGQLLKRSGARPGDLICVTVPAGNRDLTQTKRLEKRTAAPPSHEPEDEPRAILPQPQVDEGLALRPLANAANDLRDGLISGLLDILTASGMGATLSAHNLPGSCGPALKALTAGQKPAAMPTDPPDYTLIFTVPPAHSGQLNKELLKFGAAGFRCGVVEDTAELRITQSGGTVIARTRICYDNDGGSARDSAQALQAISPPDKGH